MIDLKLFWAKKRKFLFVCSVIFGIVTGIINLAIIFIITHVDDIIKHGGNLSFILSFVCCALLYLLSNYFSLSSSSNLTNRIILELRLKIQEYILESDYKKIELMGDDALYSINNDDIAKIERYAEVLPRIIIDVFTIALIILYMMFLDLNETLIFILVSAVTLIIFYFMQERLIKHYETSRKMMDKVMGNINSLIGGIRELKINAKMRKNFFNLDSVPTFNTYHNQQSLKSKYEQLLISWFWISFYAIIAISVVVLQDQHIEHKMKFIIPLLMIFGPMTMITSVASVFYSAKVALDKIHNLNINKVSIAEQEAPFKYTQMSELEYAYSSIDGERSFTIGPINFRVEPGKIIFIIGGNGSGKTTLIKLITCLYKPSNGKIIVNDKDITNEEDTICYQSYLSVIYQTPHIFSTVLAVDLASKQNQLLHYLTLFELKDKVVLDGNKLTNLNRLSYGQKKRLGLLIALLEDKPIYIFDEWAADQDPHFRKIFYLTILPELKSKGKAIIAVTHDNEYFTQADEIIELQSGLQL